MGKYIDRYSVFMLLINHLSHPSFHAASRSKSPATPSRRRRSSSARPKPSQTTTSSSNKDLWFSPNPAKRWTELFFLLYSPVWIVWVLLVLVPFKLYERLDEWGYLAVGLLAALPCVIVPYFYEGTADAAKPWSQKYWVKANLWIAIFSFIGNYFWTHYFYSLLGASYTFPAHRLNDVPITLYFMTHAYFCLYHGISNVLIRRVRHAARPWGPWAQTAAETLTVFLLSYATAYGETLTIAHFPYYTFKNREAMYSIGSLFYAIYFFVSFPMFYRMDEEGGKKGYGVWRVMVDALAAGMLVTILLDLWRLRIGHIPGVAPSTAPTSSPKTTAMKLFAGLPWLSSLLQ